MANVKTKETKMNVMRKKSLWSELKRDKMLYLMLLPGVLFFVSLSLDHLNGLELHFLNIIHLLKILLQENLLE